MINNVPNEPIQNSPSISSGMKDKGSHQSKHPTRKATTRIKIREAVNPRSRALNDFAGRSLLYLRQAFRNSQSPTTRTPKINVMVCSRFIALSVRKWKNLVCGWFSDATVYTATQKELNTPSRIRTCDLRIRSPLLYPTELWALGMASANRSFDTV
jgi:hypothetical protein